mgnify:CR=1 FL=1
MPHSTSAIEEGKAPLSSLRTLHDQYRERALSHDAPQQLDLCMRMADLATHHLHDDEKALAVEVIGSVGNKASALRLAIEGWANRVALLATGDTMAALRGLAWAAGQPAGPPVAGADRVKWIARNQEARDLLVFAVGTTYADVRRMTMSD